MIQINRHPRGARLYILGCRMHHGLLGGALAVSLTLAKKRKLAIAASVWAITDYRDFPFRNCDNH